MLVVTRKQGERIRIGGEIFVSVERIVGGKVQIGIEAPRGVLILREELIEVGDDEPTGGDHANG
jgi:carbon storage regulator